MEELNVGLDKLRTLVQDRDFLEGKGLSNEVNIRIFCYDPADEMTVQHFIEQIKTDQMLDCNIVEYNLYKIFIEICQELDILDSIPEMEESEGSEFTLEQIHCAIGEDEFIAKMKELGERKIGDVMLITGVGDVFPFMRVHKMLEAMQPHFTATPILVMYPGKFDGSYVKLFDRLTPNPYYRAFNVI
ncbi:MAG: DUF1788 domain-containing protein [Oscillospiraceae bacterium]|nr:DUF1788 domain-containing protein [Oscillospiraceae bacterium]